MPVIKQHYVPQFIMRNFADENGLLCIIDKQSSPIRAITSKATAILFENDMYETKNLDGSYFDRNVIENKFAQIEGHIANVLQAVDSKLSNRQTLSPDEEAAFALFIALQLVRLPMVREIINSSPKGRFTSDVDKEIYDKATYRMMLLSRESGFEYLKENGLELSEEAKEQLKGQSLLEYTASFTLEEEIQNHEDQVENVDKFIQQAKKYLHLEKLTPTVLNDMVNAVYVHAPDKSSGHRVQDVEISYNYIGILPANLLYDIKKGKTA